MVYVATHPPQEIIDNFSVEFLYDEEEIFFYFWDEEEMEDFMEDGSGRDWELIDCKYMAEKLSIQFEVFSKN